MNNLKIEKLVFLFYYYRISVIVAILLSAFTLKTVISESFNPIYDGFTLIPIPLVVLTIIGYLVSVILAKNKMKEFIYTFVIIGLCLVALSYFPLINAVGEKTIETMLFH